MSPEDKLLKEYELAPSRFARVIKGATGTRVDVVFLDAGVESTKRSWPVPDAAAIKGVVAALLKVKAAMQARSAAAAAPAVAELPAAPVTPVAAAAPPSVAHADPFEAVSRDLPALATVPTRIGAHVFEAKSGGQGAWPVIASVSLYNRLVRPQGDRESHYGTHALNAARIVRAAGKAVGRAQLSGASPHDPIVYAQPDHDEEGFFVEPNAAIPGAFKRIEGRIRLRVSMGPKGPVALTVALDEEPDEVAAHEAEGAPAGAAFVPVTPSAAAPPLRLAVTEDEDCKATLRAIEALSPDDRRRGFLRGSARSKANLCAMRVLASKAAGEVLTAPERELVRLYSGWGGLSLDAVRERFPAGFPAPEKRGLIHEFYTPPDVCDAVVALIAPMLPELPRSADGRVLALEPSAGIGRFIGATAARADCKMIDWRVVEFSKVSARLISALHPTVSVYAGPFEKWVDESEEAYDGEISLILSNPPYGARGEAASMDRSPLSDSGPKGKHRELDNAWAYFLRRSSELLARGGLGVYLIPSGFMTGSTPNNAKVRHDVLRRNHLVAAFRMPTALFPGAGLEGGGGFITDLVILRARGGRLPTVPAADEDINAGRYYELHPHHVLGTLVKGTGRYGGDQIEGEFTGLPASPTLRPFADAMLPEVAPRKALSPEARAERAKRRKADIVRRIESELGAAEPEVAVAVMLGREVDRYLELSAAGDSDEHVRMHAELKARFLDFKRQYGNPHILRSLQPLLEAGNVAVIRFLQVWDAEGMLTPALDASPVWEPRVVARAQGIVEALRVLYDANPSRPLILGSLPATLGSVLGVSQAEAESLARKGLPALYAAGWRLQGEGFAELVPLAKHLVGALWPRYDLAHAVAKGERPELVQGGMVHGHLDVGAVAAQAGELLAAIGPIGIESVTFTPRDGWLPANVIADWIHESFGRIDGHEYVSLVRYESFIVPTGKTWETFSGADIPHEGARALGWINGDKELFYAQAVKGKDADGNEVVLETADQVRARIAKGWLEEWVKWLPQSPARMKLLEDQYNRTFRGLVPPTPSYEPLRLLRWKGPYARTLRPHQIEGVWRLRANNWSGVAAFDVGVGKTYLAMAAIALARQEGRVRRPVVVVPNSIVWKWARDFQKQLPDYRVVVIGSSLKTVQRGEKGKRRDVEISETDSPEDRAAKWTAFQAGAYDVALLTYASFGRTQMDEASVEAYFNACEDIKRAKLLKTKRESGRLEGYLKRLAETARKIEHNEALDRGEDRKPSKPYKINPKDKAEYLKAKDRPGGLSERDEATVEEKMRQQLRSLLALPDKQVYDPGISWDQLGVDLLVIDEAQNFANGYDPSPLTEEGVEDGKPVAFLGGSGEAEGVKRFWTLDFRARTVRARQNGGGIILLSATPAKNSPKELYNLWQIVDHDFFVRMGVRTIDDFVARYCVIGNRRIPGSDLQAVEKKALAGFHNCDELREIMYRIANFKTAEDVGLKLPDAIVEYADDHGGTYEKRGAVFFDSQGNEVDISQVGITMDDRQEANFTRLRHEVADVKQQLKRREISITRGKALIGEAMSRMALTSVHVDLAAFTVDQVAVLDEVEKVPLVDPDSGKAVVKEKHNAVWTYENAEGNKRPESPKFRVLAQTILANLSCGQVVIAPKGREEVFADVLAEHGTPDELILVYDDASKADELARFASGRPRKAGDYHVVVTNAELFPSIEAKSCAVFGEDSYGDADKLRDMARAVFVARTCGHIVFCDFTVAHVWIRRVMIKAGIPAERIAILNGDVSTLERQNIAERFNGDAERMAEPAYDVVIANQVAYEGVDLNTRTCAIHHVDLPWTPSALQQRNGRGVRQGNVLSAIRIIYYFAKRSFDGKRFATIAGKSNWMRAILDGHDRVTNNPGAGLDVSDDDIDVLVSINPEETKKAARKANEKFAHLQRVKARTLAVVALRNANHRFRQAEAEADAIAREGLRRSAERDLAIALAADPDVWPWASVSTLARTAPLLVTDSGQVLAPGMRLEVPLPEGKGALLYEVGRVEPDEAFAVYTASLRSVGARDGDGNLTVAVTRDLWVRASVAELERVVGVSRAVLDSDGEEIGKWPLLTPGCVNPDGWPAAEDRAAVRAFVDELLARGSAGAWEVLSLNSAPPAWVETLWAERGAEVLAMLARDTVDAGVAIVPIAQGVGVGLAAKRGLHVPEAYAATLPPTAQGFARYLELAANEPSTNAKAFAHVAAVRYWWGPVAARTLKPYYLGTKVREAESAASAQRAKEREAAKAAPAPALMPA